ncbi:hypothetical protein [Hymenobacter psoromatis]|uniref:hypothetical protein n=1 Tax=Hymenobacter psoromatis TaxID=1484116 RepID=UPI001CC0424E|nr:hypothetical protein [Hymenobacter psoromatis]
MRHLPALLLGVLLLLPLKSCKVPDIQPFATATGEMTSAVGAGYDLVLDDLAATSPLGLSTGQQTQLLLQRDSLAKHLRVSRRALAAFNQYAKALVEVADAGVQGQASLNKIATALAGVAAAFNPVAGVAGGLFATGVQGISKNVQQIRTLKRLDRALSAADSAVQRATALLAANNQDIARIDSAAASIADAQLTGANQNVLQAYDDLTLRTARADTAAALMVEFEATAIAYNGAPADRRTRYQKRLSQLLREIARFDPVITRFFDPGTGSLPPFPASELRPTLALLAKREDFWRQRADYGISAPFQARYDRVQAELAARARCARQHRQVLQKATDLLETWATSHTALRQAVVDQRHAVSFAEVVAEARQLKEYIDKISTAFN